jgi:predicted enzyme related to lactoylglutathione lyase
MPERDGYVPGVPCWVDTSQPDPEDAVDFYRGLFGWQFENVMPQGATFVASTFVPENETNAIYETER